MSESMNSYDELQRNVGDLRNHVLRSYEKALSLNGLPAAGLREWLDIVKAMAGQVEGQLLRVAVVGAIKSGKSTFVNALVGRDHLRRGAGVITSIITRVRKGERLEATLVLKGWDEINDEIGRALVLFPSFNSSGGTAFDIRNDVDRRNLEEALSRLEGEQILGSETIDEKIALLAAYVRGFDHIRDRIGTGSPRFRFEGEEQFARHRDFAGDDSLAVYLRDLQLSIPGAGFLNDTIEIADCQGVDSINPRHLAMIQEYLVRANLIIYVISSRTGLRRADMGFLSLLQQMGFADSILFVLNVDILEHENLADLGRIHDRVKEELAMVVENPRVYAFSSLYWLFEALGDRLSSRDRSRFEQWKEDRDMIAFCEDERARFSEVLERGFGRERSMLLLKNHLERLQGATASLLEWSSFNDRILSGGVEEARETLASVHLLRRQLESQKQAIRDSLEGRSAKVKHELSEDTERFLDARYGELSADIHDFVEHYSVDLRTLARDVKDEGFSSLLYRLFQEFRTALERFVAEKMNPRLVSFIRQEEKKAEDMFRSIAEVYEAMVEDAYGHHAMILEKSGLKGEGSAIGMQKTFDMKNFRRLSSPSMPSFLSTLQFGAEIRVESILKLGLYKGMRLVRTALKRPAHNDGPDRDVLLALANALRRIKKETHKSLASSVNGYKENLKYQHFYPFVEAMSREILEVTMDRFRVFSSDMSDLANLVESAQAEKDGTVEALRELKNQVRELQERAGGLEKALQS